MLGIDIGTQSIRTYIFNEKAEMVAGKITEQYVKVERPTWVSQRADFWWEAITADIRKILGKSGVNPKDIVSVGCCAHMHGPVPVAKDGRVLMEDIQLYCDKRASDVAQELRGNKDEKCYGIVANTLTSTWFGIKIGWIKKHCPQVYEDAYKFLTPKDFINYRLTGQACIDPSEASGAYAMDWRTMEWSDYVLDHIGLDKEKLPGIYGSFDVIGQVTRKAAQETGLCAGTKVVCGCGDMFASMYVSGLHHPGACVDLTATASVLCCNTPIPLLDKRVLNLKSILEGWGSYGELDGSGAGYRWVRDVLAKEEAKAARKMGVDPYDYLSGLAEKIPAGAQGLIYMPYMLGERIGGTEDSRGCFIGLHLGSEMGQIVRAVLEGITFEMKRSMDIFEGHGYAVDKVYHVSGGARSALWNQIKADIYQKPVYTLKETEGSVLGAALVGGVGAEIFPDPKEAADLVFQMDREFLPDSRNAEIYTESFGIFKELYGLLQKPFANLAQMNR